MNITSRVDEARHAIDQIFTGFTNLAGALQGLDSDLAALTRDPVDEHYRDPQPEPAVLEETPATEPESSVHSTDAVTTHTDDPTEPEPEPEPVPEVNEETPEPAPEPEPTITLEDVRTRLAELSRAGHTNAVRELIQQHDVQKLSDIPEASYPDLLAAAKDIA